MLNKINTKKGCRYIYRRTGLIIEAIQDGRNIGLGDNLHGVVIVGDSCNPEVGRAGLWIAKIFEPLCSNHEWVEMLDCQFPFKCCKVCKEIESLEQVG